MGRRDNPRFTTTPTIVGILAGTRAPPGPTQKKNGYLAKDANAMLTGTLLVATTMLATILIVVSGPGDKIAS
jgi:hypothetical protein